jgi:protein-disulfide isomerase
MLTTRRILLSAAVAAGAAGLVRPAWAATDETKVDRSIGSPDAKTVVAEYFSLTCTHCAAFSRETLPEIKTKLIDTGKVRWVFHDFPLDQVALEAAQVAHYLPQNRYEPFIDALFNTQDRWAFSRGANPTDELWKMAALAGMTRPTFDKAISDTSLRDWILSQQKQASAEWKIDSTPSFVIDGKKYAGEMGYDAFVKLIPNS